MMIARLLSMCAAIESDVMLVSSNHFLEYDPVLDDKPSLDEVAMTLCGDASEIIENYAAKWDSDYHPSCLVRGEIPQFGQIRISHVVCTYPPNPFVIVTAYWCDTEPDEWDDECRRRRR